MGNRTFNTGSLSSVITVDPITLNVGIGGAPTAYKANVTGAVAATNFVLSGATGNTGIYYGHTDRVVLANYTAGGIDFEVNGGSVSMTLFPTGNLSIGTAATDGGYKLDVLGTARFSGQLNGTSSIFSGLLTAQRGNFYQGASSGFAIAMRNRNATQEWGFVVDTDAVDDKNFGLYSTQGALYAIKLNSTTGAAAFSNKIFVNSGIGVGISSLSAWGAIVLPMIEGGTGTSIGYYNNAGIPIMYLNANTYFNGSAWLYKISGKYATTISVGAFDVTSAFEVNATNATGTAGGTAAFSRVFNISQSGVTTFANTLTNRIGITVFGAAGAYTTGDNPFIGLGTTASDTFGAINAPFGDRMRFNAYHGFEWYTANGGASGTPVTKMLMSSVGNLLIGTTTDNGNKLQVNGAMTATAIYRTTGTNTLNLASTGVNYLIIYNAFSGMLAVRDNTTGGSAVYLLDPNLGVNTISTNLTFSIAFLYSGGNWYAQRIGGINTNIGFMLYGNN